MAEESVPVEKKAERGTDVLIVEDDSFLSDLLSTKFISEGFTVVVARNGEDGLEMVEKTTPRIVLLDIVMPVMDGYQFLESLKGREYASKIPIIVLSNLGQEEEIAKAMELGALHFLVKANFTPDQVCEKVRDILKAGASDSKVSS